MKKKLYQIFHRQKQEQEKCVFWIACDKKELVAENHKFHDYIDSITTF